VNGKVRLNVERSMGVDWDESANGKGRAKERGEGLRMDKN